MKIRAAALAIVASFMLAGSALSQDLGPQIRKLADGIYVYVGTNFNSNCGIVLTQDGVVLIDSGHNPTDSRAVLDSLQRSLRSADERVKEMAGQVRALKGADFPQIAQLNQGAVGLVTVTMAKDSSVWDGSGFVISPSGYFLTNRHVVIPEGTAATAQKQIVVTMSDHSFSFLADIVMISPPPGPDVALLKIRNYKGPVVAKIDWTGSHARQGEGAALIGFPAGFQNAADAQQVVRSSMTAGNFATVTPELIQFAGLSVQGSSGSPLFNGAGEVVGLHLAGLREKPGFGYAVPLARVVPFLPADVRAELGLSAK